MITTLEHNKHKRQYGTHSNTFDKIYES